MKPRSKPARVRAKRTPRRRGRRSRRQSSVLPPTRSITSNYYHTTTQTILDVSQGQWQTASYNPSSYSAPALNFFGLFNTWTDRFEGLFHEYKISRITARYIPYAASNQPGSYIFSMSEADENQDEAPKFASLIGLPGTVIRKIYQPSKLVWFPTEPSDREWRVIPPSGTATGHIYVNINIASFEDVYHVEQPSKIDTNVVYEKARLPDRAKTAQEADISGKIVLDIQVTFRGSHGPKRTNIWPFNSSIAAALFQCNCRRCLIRKYRQLETDNKSDNGCRHCFETANKPNDTVLPASASASGDVDSPFSEMSIERA